MRRRSVVWLAATGAVLLAAVLGVRSWVLRDRTEPVSVDRVVTHYRGATATATPTLPAGVHVPEAGVYTYATSGSEEATLLGTSRHPYPSSTTLTVVPEGCGFSATWEALDKRSERWTQCALPGALTTTRFDDVHSFFGRTDTRTYECTGGPVALTESGEPTTVTCAKDDTKRTDRIRAVGREQLTVGGETVPTIHLRTSIRMSGATRGTGTADRWLDRETGLPVRVRVRIDNETDTPIGKPAQYREDYELELTSLEPQR